MARDCARGAGCRSTALHFHQPADQAPGAPSGEAQVNGMLDAEVYAGPSLAGLLCGVNVIAWPVGGAPSSRTQACRRHRGCIHTTSEAARCGSPRRARRRLAAAPLPQRATRQPLLAERAAALPASDFVDTVSSRALGRSRLEALAGAHACVPQVPARCQASAPEFSPTASGWALCRP